MRALLLDEFGTDLRERRIDRPEPQRGEVLVRIASSGVNPLDVKIKAGQAAHAQVVPPFILGIDLAGVIEAVGAGVNAFHVGDRVYGMTGGVGNQQGSLAEYAAVDARLLACAPKTITLREAAALPLAAISAWEALVDRAAVSTGDTVLVHGGAGGVGRMAVQLATSRGAVVFATGSPHSFDTIRSLGASPIDRETPVASYVTQSGDGEGFDVVFDTVGGTVLDNSFQAVRRYTGHVVSILGWGTHNLAPLSFRGATYSGVFTLLPLLTGEDRAHHGEILTAIAELVDAGKILPGVSDDRYGWSTVNEAHERVAAGRGGTGKMVVDLQEDLR